MSETSDKKSTEDFNRESYLRWTENSIIQSWRDGPIEIFFAAIFWHYFAPLIAAQRLFWPSAIFRRDAALTRRFLDAAAVCSAAGFFAGPWRASMARFSLSRSAIRRETMWSVGIDFDGSKSAIKHATIADGGVRLIP